MKQTKVAKQASKGLLGALILAGGTSAYGDIVTVAPPANFNVTPGTATAGPVNWDVNGDGTADFSFTYRYPNTATGSGVVWQANINSIAATSNVVSYAGPFVRYAFALQPNATISAASPFSPSTAAFQTVLGSRYRSAGVPSYYGGFAAGPNANGAVPPGTVAYAGFRFSAADGVHFGYVQLSIGPGSINFVRAAYQSTPGAAIAAGAIPEPGTMALLALGAMGVVGAAIKRRRA